MQRLLVFVYLQNSWIEIINVEKLFFSF